MKQRTERFWGKYDVFTFFLIPGSTLLLASTGSWTGTNLSAECSLSESRLAFAMWGTFLGGYFGLYAGHLFRLGRYRRAWGQGLIRLAVCFLLLAVAIPYVPDSHPVGAALHVLFAFFSPILFAAGLACFLHFVSQRDRPRFKRAWLLFWMVLGMTLLMLLQAGFITTFLEVFLVLSIGAYMRYVEGLLIGRTVKKA